MVKDQKIRQMEGREGEPLEREPAGGGFGLEPCFPSSGCKRFLVCVYSPRVNSPCTVLGLKVQPSEVSFSGHLTHLEPHTHTPPPLPSLHRSFWFFLRSLPSLLRLEFPGTGCSLEPVGSLPAFPLPVGWGPMGGGPAGWSEVGLQR